jgi:ATP-dependent protease ClpP protease subunit
MIASGADHYLSAADAFRLGLLTRVEPADTQPISRLSLSMYFSTRKAKALSQLATMARARGSAGPSVVNVTLKGEFGPNRSIKASGVRKQLSEGRFASSMLVFIDSIGGDYIEAMRIYAMLREHPARRKKAIISGDCQSAAIVPLLACDIRVAQQRATLLLHRASINPWENRGRRWTAEQLQEAAAQAEGVDDATADLLAERTGHDRNWFRKEMESERPLRLVDALRVGILHQICGVTSPPNPAWAQRVASMAHAGTVIGLSSHMFSSSYLAACKAMMG